MKKHLFLLAIIIGLSASTAFSMNADPKIEPKDPPIPNKTENKLSEEEVSRLTTRVEAIRDIDKSNLTSEEKLELKNERRADEKVYWQPL